MNRSLRRSTVGVISAVLLSVAVGCSDSDSTPSTSPSPDDGAPATTPATDAADVVVGYPLAVKGAKQRTRIFTPSGYVDVVGTMAAVLPNGTVLVDRYPAAGIKGRTAAVVDSKTGQDIAVDGRYAPEAWFRSVTADSLLLVAIHAGVQTLRELDLTLNPVRAVRLPGPPDAVAYRSLAKVGEVTFVETAEIDGIDTRSDSITRVDENGNVTSILKDKHIANLRASSTGEALLATVAASGPLYEGLAATKDIVELDPSTGEILKSYGVPPPCVTFVPVGPSEDCFDRFDKVGSVLVATVFESSAPAEDGYDGYSTWQYTDGQWAELESQHGKLVVWGSRSQRIEFEPTLKNDVQQSARPIYYVEATRRELQGSESLLPTDIFATGSLVRP